MGRPKKGEELEATSRLAFRLDEATKKKLEECAARDGLSLTDVIREALMYHIAVHDNAAEQQTVTVQEITARSGRVRTPMMRAIAKLVEFGEGRAAIYQIKHNVADGRVYVGSTKTLGRRLTTHYSKLKEQRHYCTELQNAWYIHGEDAFLLDVLEWVTDGDSLAEREQYWMDKLQACVRGRGFNFMRTAMRQGTAAGLAK